MRRPRANTKMGHRDRFSGRVNLLGVRHGLPRRLLMLILLLPPFLQRATTADHGSKPNFASNEHCYAFGAHWRIYTVCDGKKAWIDVPYAIQEFAISSDGSSLAFWKAGPTARAYDEQESMAIRVTGLVVVSLSPGFKTTEKEVNFRSIPDLRATCGTIVGFFPGVPDLSQGAWDLSAPPGAPPYPPSEDILTGKPLQFTASNIFRCSSDRRVVATLVKGSAGGNRELLSNVDGKEVRKFPADSEEVNAWARNEFSVSPNGKYVAYAYTDKNTYKRLLCVSRAGGSPVCTPYEGGSLTVSDDGQVIYSVLFTGAYGGPEAQGIAFWRPGLLKRVVLERQGYFFYPQWITSDVVTRLNEWSSALAH